MSDGIFYYPKYLLYGKFIYIFLGLSRKWHETGENIFSLLYEISKRVYMNDNEA